MADSGKKLYYRRAGVTYSCILYTSPTDVGAEYVVHNIGGFNYYAKIGSVGDSNQSHLRIQKSGVTKSILTMAGSVLAPKVSYPALGTYTYTVPAGVTSLPVKLWGAGGGGYSLGLGGAGGFVGGSIPVTPGESLTVLVGGPGGPCDEGALHNGGSGGYGGGGAGGYSASYDGGGGGGGASRILRGSTILLVAAGGGGGSIMSGYGGAGGGTTGLTGGNTGGGTGGTQTGGGYNGGTFGQGGVGASVTGEAHANGGGGGGYYGGGGGTGGGPWSGTGGGGSSYVAAGIVSPVNLAGSGQTPGNSEDADRGGAGANATAGKVVLGTV